MKISVIIPTLNEEKRIGNLLEDLHAQSFLPHEIIVIDATSQDATKDVVQSFKGVAFHQMGKGVGHQRHAGGQKASGELFIFLDADTRLENTFLEQVLSHMREKDLEIACPKYIPDSGLKYMEVIYSGFNLLFWVFQKISPSGAGSCIITSKRAFIEMGGFDGSLQFDDIAYIRKAGRKYGFKQIPITVSVSDRRFHEYGILKMLGLYSILSVLFFFGQFRLANKVNYTFGKYTNQHDKTINST